MGDMTTKLIGKKFKGTIDVKRLYIEGVKVESVCPKCKIKFKEDVGGDKLNYPTLNKPHNHHFYCGECNAEWDVPLIFEMTCRLAGKT